MLEVKIQRQIIEQLELLKIPYIRVTKSNRRGMPDLIIFGLYFTWLVELKRSNGGALSDHQRVFLKTLRRCKSVKTLVCNGTERPWLEDR
jgi:hypothetical protein